MDPEDGEVEEEREGDERNSPCGKVPPEVFLAMGELRLHAMYSINRLPYCGPS